MVSTATVKSLRHEGLAFLGMVLGTFLVALALKVFLAPNGLIDGGVVGISMLCSYLFGREYLPYFIVGLNLPFLILGYKLVGRRFVLHMLAAVVALGVFSFFLNRMPPFRGEALEIIVFGGLCLGIGTGLVIRMGGAVDGTEILAIIINRKRGFTVGQVIFFFNIFIFALSGFVEQHWHPALRSFMTYIVAYKIMDTVIVGLDETKAVRIITAKPRELAESLMHELNLGVTILYGRGGYSGEDKEILYVIVERLQLSGLKELVHREDPTAFLAVENLYEVISGVPGAQITRKKQIADRLKQELS
jgi:uncharacterized membrane-anchored protein YitT (DUF2179 family)